MQSGHWRGAAAVEYEDGSQRAFSYTKSICAYKNAGFFVKQSCLKCKDQFAACADISFGDVWLREVKKDAVKYTGFIVRSQHALEMLKTAHQQGDIRMRPLSGRQILQSQMRALEPQAGGLAGGKEPDIFRGTSGPAAEGAASGSLCLYVCDPGIA